jgi:hypothetical protein
MGTSLIVPFVAAILLVLAGWVGWSGAQTSAVSRDELATRLDRLVRDARNEIYIAATDCTFSLVSQPLRAKAAEPGLRGKVVVALDQKGKCGLPGYQPVPTPYTLEVRRLVPLRVDEGAGMIYRREFVLIDRSQLTVILSEAHHALPSAYHVETATIEDDPKARDLVRQLGALLWPGLFVPPAGSDELRGDPRWSLTNHRNLTREVLKQLEFASVAISVVEAGNVNVDRLANQFNNPQHSMRNVGQSVEEARAAAADWIASRKVAVVNRLAQGDVCCALFALGEALHTVQDRKHGWIPLYRHLLHETISDYKPHADAEDWVTAQRDTRALCDEIVSTVGSRGREALAVLRAGTSQQCVCDGFRVSPKP